MGAINPTMATRLKKYENGGEVEQSNSTFENNMNNNNDMVLNRSMSSAWENYKTGNDIGTSLAKANPKTNPLGGVQDTLSVLGLTPGIAGVAADISNAGLSFGQGNFKEGFTNLVSAADPTGLVGIGSTGNMLGNRIGEKLAGVFKKYEKGGEVPKKEKNELDEIVKFRSSLLNEQGYTMGDLMALKANMPKGKMLVDYDDIGNMDDPEVKARQELAEFFNTHVQGETTRKAKTGQPTTFRQDTRTKSPFSVLGRRRNAREGRTPTLETTIDGIPMIEPVEVVGVKNGGEVPKKDKKSLQDLVFDKHDVEYKGEIPLGLDEFPMVEDILEKGKRSNVNTRSYEWHDDDGKEHYQLDAGMHKGKILNEQEGKNLGSYNSPKERQKADDAIHEYQSMLSPDLDIRRDGQITANNVKALRAEIEKELLGN